MRWPRLQAVACDQLTTPTLCLPEHASSKHASTSVHNTVRQMLARNASVAVVLALRRVCGDEGLYESRDRENKRGAAYRYGPPIAQPASARVQRICLDCPR